MLNIIADTLPQTFVAAQQDQVGWMLISVIIAGIITACWVSSAQPETRYHYQPGRKARTAPTKRADSQPVNPCTCGECCCCDPTIPAAVETPPVLLAFGGLSSLPLYPSADDADLLESQDDDTDEQAGVIPDWLAPAKCGACKQHNEAVCFLCPACQLLVPRRRIEQVFDLCAAEQVGRAWELAEAIIRDVTEYRAAVMNDGRRISYSKN